ncbi:hypothetical protein [Salinispora arenicola]|uniref:hypothetical protein n=1 Tax=Salinispora arenicola TaxID=168697 RepID=UPI0012BC7C97|nr:hypothetical protein [Salinispora arenicola]MCN0151888.1 hypothetical protein [Salinispora arenicola]
MAARALWRAPIAEIVVPTLLHALPQLQPRPEHQRIAALTLLSLTDGQPLDDWATDPNPVLRRIAAQHLPMGNGQSMTPAIAAMLHDVDGYVIEAVLRRLHPLSDAAAEAEFERIAAERNPGWLCIRCATQNQPGRYSCSQCHVVGPEPADLAAALLTGTMTRPRVILDLDDFDD